MAMLILNTRIDLPWSLPLSSKQLMTVFYKFVEIRQLHLTANLVTLSACNTGLGPVGQTGVSNVVNAFIEAGAQSVVSTLWETEDHATKHLMTAFYSYLSHQDSKAEALRKAKLEMLNAGLLPYYWAAFELVGDPAGILPGESNQTRAYKK